MINPLYKFIFNQEYSLICFQNLGVVIFELIKKYIKDNYLELMYSLWENVCPLYFLWKFINLIFCFLYFLLLFKKFSIIYFIFNLKYILYLYY